MTGARYWYHVTDKAQWGAKVVLQPRVPSTFAIDEAGEPIEDCDTKRICVGPTPAHCLTAIGPSSCFFIYRTFKKLKAIKPTTKQVPDVSITQERWLKRPTTFVRVKEITRKHIKRLLDLDLVVRGSNLPQDLTEQKKDLEKIKAILR